MAVRVKVLVNDISRRYMVGEEGILLVNDFREKYQYKVLLYGTDTYFSGFPGVKTDDVIPRVYYFYAPEIEVLDKNFDTTVDTVIRGAERCPTYSNPSMKKNRRRNTRV